MNDQDLDSFEKWLEIEFGEEVDKSRSWLYEKSIFSFACEYKENENTDLKDEIDKLNKINDHLVNQLMHALELK